MFSLNVQGIF